MATKFYNFLIFCSGCDPDVLDECPKSEKVKFSCIGATVLFTGVLASISGGYALYTIFRDLYIAIVLSILFGLLWGAVIFNIDRFLVSTLKKKGNIKKELLLATPRFIMAIIISLVVAKPLEVRIFQDRIISQIYDNKNNASLKEKLKLDTLYNQSILANELTQKENDLHDLENKRDKGDPETPEFKELLGSLNIAKKNLTATINTNTPQINELEKNIVLIKQQKTYHDQSNIPKLPDDARSQINAIINKKRGLVDDINNRQNVVTNIEHLVSVKRESYQTEITHRIDNEENAEKKVGDNKAVSDSLTRIETMRGDTSRAISFKNTFVTEMEALGDLTHERFSTMWWTSILISALILLIEISPILTKILSDRGPYDEKIDTRDLKIADYEVAERKVNKTIAQDIYLSDNILLKKVEHFTNTAKESTETLLEFMNSNYDQSKEFDELMSHMNETIDKINDPQQKVNYQSNQTSVIDIYDNFRKKIFSLYRKVLGSVNNNM